MLSLKLGSFQIEKNTFIVIPVFQYLETSLNYLENSLVQSDFGFINYIVINNVILMLYPLSKKCFMFYLP
jgi:hypothetical protein